jgi:hypothetical protein
MKEPGKMGRPGEVEMLQWVEDRLGVALHVVGGRWNAINAGDPCATEEAAYCEGFCDALRYLFGTDAEASQIMDELVAQWDESVRNVDEGEDPAASGTIYRLADAEVADAEVADAEVADGEVAASA